MNDEEFASFKERRQGLRDLAKNPTDEMTVYRMQGGAHDSLGIHWTTDSDVAHSSGIAASEENRQVHRATVSRDQVMTEGQWKGNNIRSFSRDKDGIRQHPSQWGFDSEAEVRLRPGSTVRDHAVAPQGVHEYTPTGKEPTIEARGYNDYIGLAAQSVQSTPEADRLHSIQGSLPHVQQAMFDTVVSQEGATSGQVIGHTPKLSLIRGGMGFKDALSFTTDDVNRIGQSAGLSEWGAGTEKGHEPPLSEVRDRPRQEEFEAGRTAVHPSQGRLF